MNHVKTEVTFDLHLKYGNDVLAVLHMKPEHFMYDTKSKTVTFSPDGAEMVRKKKHALCKTHDLLNYNDIYVAPAPYQTTSTVLKMANIKASKHLRESKDRVSKLKEQIRSLEKSLKQEEKFQGQVAKFLDKLIVRTPKLRTTTFTFDLNYDRISL